MDKQAKHALPSQLLRRGKRARNHAEILDQRWKEVLDAHERHEIYGLRDGVLRLEALLLTVRQTIDAAPTCPAQPHIADAVEDSVTPARLKAQPHSR